MPAIGDVDVIRGQERGEQLRCRDEAIGPAIAEMQNRSRRSSAKM